MKDGFAFVLVFWQGFLFIVTQIKKEKGFHTLVIYLNPGRYIRRFAQVIVVSTINF